MKPERWAELKKLYNELVDLDPNERDPHLAAIPDPGLRREVISLIEAGPLSSEISGWLREERGRLLVSQAVAAAGQGLASTRSPIPHAFSPGDLLAERYRIIGVLGQGGMGEVYEAEDQDLRERIAIKVIASQVDVDQAWIERFRREVQLARRVTHPNVCRVFDLERHRQQDREIIFLTMELVQGETLAARLKRSGRFSTADALPIATQLCSALQAAHQAGILHRDFKCGNVMLVGSGHRVRAVVTDFGTARLMDSGFSSMQTLTQQSVILGTPAYMSPEQLTGKELTTASDIYSLGLVLYEMVTGARPFQSDSTWTEAVKRLSEDPEPPLKIAPEIGDHWNSTTLRCLDRDPGKRLSSAQEVLDLLQANGQGLEIGGAKARFNSLRQRWTWGLIALFVLVPAFMFFLVFRAHPVHALTAKDTIVLADFTNNTGEPIFDGSTLKDALAIGLEQSPLLNILSDIKIARTLNLMGRQSGERLTSDVAREICLRSYSRALITGSIATLGSHYAIYLKATNCQTGDILGAAEAEANSREETVQTLGQAATVLRSKIGESLASVQRFDKPLPEATTSSLEALQAYSEAGKVWREQGASAAIPLQERAVKLDPNFALAYSGLGLLYRDARQRGLAIESSRKAYELREHVSIRERYIITYEYYVNVTGELHKAVEQYRLLAQEYPNSAEAPYGIGGINIILGQYDDAEREMKELLQVDPSLGIGLAAVPYICIALNRPNEAQTLLSRTLSGVPEAPFPHYVQYMLGFVRNDETAMKQQALWAQGKAWVEGTLLSLESANQAFHGRLGKAVELSRRAFAADKRDLSPEAAADVDAVDAIRYAEFGYPQDARKAAHKALIQGASTHTTLISFPGNSFAVATLALARAGDIPATRTAANTLSQKAPLDTLIQNFWLPTIRAEIEIKNGHPARAIELLRTAGPYDLIDVGAMASIYTRGRAYLALGDGSAAAQEFQKMLDHNQLAWYRFPTSLAHVGLARANVLQARSATGPAAQAAEAQARGAYENFFALWKDADLDIPILRQAKAEYAKLASK